MGLIDVFQPSDSTSNLFTANSYNDLGTRATTSGFTPVTTHTAGVATNQVAMALAVAQASDRETEERTEVLNSAVDLIKSGDNAEARNIAQGLLDKDGQDASAAHIIARSYLAEKDYDKAEQYFARASTLAPSSQRFASDLANVRLLTKSDDEAMEEAARMVRQPERRLDGIRLAGYIADRSPGNAEAHMMLGDALLDEGLAVGAVASYRNALVAADEGNIEQLVERLRALAAKAPDVGVTHSLLGQALQKQGKYDEAMVELKRAAEIAPTNMSYHYAVASVYGAKGKEALDAGRSQEAIRHYETATAMDPNSGDLKSGLARAHVAMSKWWLARGLDSKAFDELSAARVHAPSGDEALNKDLARSFNLLGDRYRHKDDLDWAISAYQRAYDIDSTNYGYRNDLASTCDAKGTEYFDAREYESAETYYKKAVDLFPGRETYQTRLQAAHDAQT